MQIVSCIWVNSVLWDILAIDFDILLWYAIIVKELESYKEALKIRAEDIVDSMSNLRLVRHQLSELKQVEAKLIKEQSKLITTLGQYEVG